MSDAQAGTPEVKPDGSDAGTPVEPKEGSGLNAQQQKEFMTLKQKAEDYNKLERELATERVERERLSRIASGGVAATDPYVEAYNQAVSQSEFDPIARLTVMNAQKATKAEAEAWLANELLSVPEQKRQHVAGLIRANGYQMSRVEALNLVTDPEAKTLAETLANVQAELDRLKNAKPNGISPAAVTPASANADDGKPQEYIDRADYVAALTAARQENASDAIKLRARTLMEAVGSNKTRFKT